MNQPPKQKFDVGRTLPAAPAGAKRPAVPFKQPPAEKTLSSKVKRIVLAAVAVLAALILIIGVWDSINVSRAAKKTFGSGNIFSLLTPSGLKNAGGRTNLLIAGYSLDDTGHSGADLTDSIMLVSLNTKTHTGYMLSIPRDLLVNIPGTGYGKINEVYHDGGISSLEQVVSADFGVPINYYALVNYGAVRDTVNALGGVWVNIKSSDPRGLFDPNINVQDGGPLKLTNGWHKLNGQTALNLTRARGEPCDCAQSQYGFNQSDFDRTEHQRQVFAAIKDRLGWTLALNPLKNGRVFDAVGRNVKTDIKLPEVRPFVSLLKSTNLQSYSLRDLNGKNYLTGYSSGSLGSALIPSAGLDDYSAIRSALSSL